MRAVVQRVESACVRVDGRSVGEIGGGLLVYLGIGGDDRDSDFQYILQKILGLRIFADDRGYMNLSVKDVEGSILLVSQFTLYGDVRKGKRPSFTDAMAPDNARGIYESLIAAVRAQGVLCEHGEFGAMMKVSSVNDGPVTILLDSRKQF